MSNIEPVRDLLVIPAYGGMNTQDPAGDFLATVAGLQEHPGIDANVIPLPYPAELADAAPGVAAPPEGSVGRARAAEYVADVLGRATPGRSGLLIVNPHPLHEVVPELAPPSLHVRNAVSEVAADIASQAHAQVVNRQRVPVWTTHPLPQWDDRVRGAPLKPAAYDTTRTGLNAAEAKPLTTKTGEPHAKHTEHFKRYYTPKMLKD